MLASMVYAGLLISRTQNLPACQNSHAIWRLAWASLALGLGCFTQRPPMGKPVNGLAIVRGLFARDPSQF